MLKKKCLKIIFCITIIASLCFSKSGFAQQGAAKSLVIDAQRFRTTRVAGTNLAAAYNVIASKQLIDFDDNAFFADPSGRGRFSRVIVNDGLYLDFTEFGNMVMSNGGTYSIDLQEPFGDSVFKNLTAVKFVMTGGAPIPGRDNGHYVWDIAEGINVESGDICDVVVISKDKDMTVTRSISKFDSKVAGVISESPKIYMGADEKNKPLALSGVVKCNVNTENGPIKRGDILVTSSEPGYAMKADENQILPGMIVGSALDSLEQGKGKIYILIN